MIAAAVIGGCTGGTPAEAPAPVSTVPPDWVTVTTSAGDVQLLLPTWLVPFDNVNAIYANERPAAGGPIEMQLMASGAGFMQPPPSMDIAAWIDVQLHDVGSGVPAVSHVALPAGPALRYERIDRAGTPGEWHILAYVVRTPSGYAYLQLDGSPAGWQRRASDFEWIAMLMRAR